MIIGQGPIVLAVGAGGGCLDIFTLLYPFSPLSPALWETARYRLKYWLKGPLNPKQPSNQNRYPDLQGVSEDEILENMREQGVINVSRIKVRLDGTPDLKVPFTDVKPCINTFLRNKQQLSCSAAVFNRLHAIKLALGEWQPSYRIDRKEEVFLARLKSRSYFYYTFVFAER